MRPKKDTVLLICKDDIRESLLRFMLQTWRYVVVTDAQIEVDLALFVDDASLQTEDLAYTVSPEIPLLVILQKGRRGVNYPMHAELLIHHIGNAKLLERIRILLCRKDGPRSIRPALQEATT